MDDHDALMRFCGMREMAAGIGILSQPYPAGWVWGRVGGDAMDITLLALALRNDRNRRGRVAGALAFVAGITALDVVCALQMSRQPRAGRHIRANSSRIVKTIAVNRTPEELYAFWRDYNNLPRFMMYLDSVQPLGERRATWSYKGPGRMRMDLDVELTEESTNRAISWRATSRSRFEMRARVQFVPAPGEARGTIVRMEMQFRSGGPIKLPGILGKLPGEMATQNLRRFKQLVEVGEILTNEGQPSGRRKYERTVSTAERGEIEQPRAEAEARI
jgi:uncharacterized membrane protein